MGNRAWPPSKISNTPLYLIIIIVDYLINLPITWYLFTQLNELTNTVCSYLAKQDKNTRTRDENTKLCECDHIELWLYSIRTWGTRVLMCARVELGHMSWTYFCETQVEDWFVGMSSVIVTAATTSHAHPLPHSTWSRTHNLVLQLIGPDHHFPLHMHYTIIQKVHWFIVAIPITYYGTIFTVDHEPNLCSPAPIYTAVHYTVVWKLC